jgi:hypothetical protein
MRLLLCTVLLISLLGAGSDVPEMTVTRIAQSRADLARYASSHALDDLEAAVADLDGTIDLDDLSGENFTATRRMLVQAWSTALKAVEGAYDPTFDPNDPKNRFPGCMPSPAPAPVSCPDAVNRRWQYYEQVSRIDRRTAVGLEMSLKLLNSVAPAGYGFDYDALDRILQQSGISKARRAEIDQAFVESDPHQWRVPMNASATEVPAVTVERVNASSIALARYTASHALNDLSRAVDALDEHVDVGALTSSNFDKTWRALAQAWAAVIKRIEDAYSPTLSPNSYILVRKLDNRAIAGFVTLLRQFNGECSTCAQSSPELDKLLQQAGLSQATRARIAAASTRMLPLASP